MRYLERKHLLNLCEKYDELDEQEIDNNLTYYENKKHLLNLINRMRPKNVDELSDDEYETYEEWAKGLKPEDFYGIDERKCETPLLLQKLFLKIPHHRPAYTKAVLGTLRGMEVVWFDRDYVLIIGSRGDLAKILDNLRHRNIYYQIMKLKLKYPVGFQYESGSGWVKRPDS